MSPTSKKRFNDLYDNFYEVFKNCDFDIIGILPVHKVEGRDSRAVRTVEGLIKKLGHGNNKFVFLGDYHDAVTFLGNNLKKGDIVVTMGATDVYKVTEQYLRGLRHEQI